MVLFVSKGGETSTTSAPTKLISFIQESTKSIISLGGSVQVSSSSNSKLSKIASAESSCIKFTPPVAVKHSSSKSLKAINVNGTSLTCSSSVSGAITSVVVMR